MSIAKGKHNELGCVTRTAILQCLEQSCKDDAKAVVFTGAGKQFSVGGDRFVYCIKMFYIKYNELFLIQLNVQERIYYRSLSNTPISKSRDKCFRRFKGPDCGWCSWPVYGRSIGAGPFLHS